MFRVIPLYELPDYGQQSEPNSQLNRIQQIQLLHFQAVNVVIHFIFPILILLHGFRYRVELLFASSPEERYQICKDYDYQN